MARFTWNINRFVELRRIGERSWVMELDLSALRLNMRG
jgi:hypothetical protein